MLDLAGLEKAFTHLAIKHELVERALKDRPSLPGGLDDEPHDFSGQGHGGAAV